jgi:oxygen-dependent protoporphyrinogen oxidase
VALARTPLLGAGGKLRLLAEPFVRRRDACEESVAEFVSRRLGRQVATALVGPFLTGVYAGDERELGAEAVFGGLTALERRFGSLALGGLVSLLARRGPRGRRGVWSAAHGLGPLARQLAARLPEPPALGARVTSLSFEDSGWRLSMTSAAGDTQVRARRVVLALTAFEAAALLRGVDARAAELLDGIVYAPVVSLPLGLAHAALATPVEGFGFLAPREAGLHLLGCLYMSRLFPDRAPRDHELLQCMLGGVRWPGALEEPEDVLEARACEDLDRLLGLRDAPKGLGAARWARAIPQPGREHPRRLAELRARVSALPGLALAGAWVAGVGVADCFASGVRAARELARPV